MSSIVRLNRNPTPRQLRQFGVTTMFALPLMSWMAMARIESVLWVSAAGVSLAVIGWVRPLLLRPVFIAVTMVTYPLGTILGEITLLLIFFGLLAPLGILFRITGRTVIPKTPDPTASTYWQPRQPPGSAETYFRQS